MSTKTKKAGKTPTKSKSAARAEGAQRTKARLKEVAAADQENARARDERDASPDGMLASERAMAATASKGSKAAAVSAAMKKAAAEDKARAAAANRTEEIVGPATGASALARGKGRKKAGKAPAGAPDATAANVAPQDAKPARKRKAAKAAEPKPKRFSALDAAAQILAASDTPMRAKEMIAAMEAKGLWKSPGGKTPEATLYAAIIREIAAKGDKARFKKHERGVFVAPPRGKGA